MFLLLIAVTATPATSAQVQIRIESPRPVELIREVTVAEDPHLALGYTLKFPRTEDRTVCVSPCRRALDPGSDDFVIAGDGIVRSDPFRLDRRSSAVIEVRPGSTRLRTAAIIVAFGAVVSAIAGVAGLVVDLTSPRREVGVFTISALLSYAGLVAIGTTLFAFSRTLVTVREL